MSNESVPTWPRIEAVAREDGTGEVTVDGASFPVAERTLDQARVAIIGRVTETAERLGRPVRVSTDGPDGHWPLVVHPNGHVAADDDVAAAGDPTGPSASAAGASGADHEAGTSSTRMTNGAGHGIEPGVPTLPAPGADDASAVPHSPRTALRQPARSEDGSEEAARADQDAQVDQAARTTPSNGAPQFHGAADPASEEQPAKDSAGGELADPSHWDQDREDDSLVGELLAGDPPKPDSAVEVTQSRRLDWKSVWEPSDRWNLRRSKKEELPKLRFHESIPALSGEQSPNSAEGAVMGSQPTSPPSAGESSAPAETATEEARNQTRRVRNDLGSAADDSVTPRVQDQHSGPDQQSGPAQPSTSDQQPGMQNGAPRGAQGPSETDHANTGQRDAGQSGFYQPVPGAAGFAQSGPGQAVPTQSGPTQFGFGQPGHDQSAAGETSQDQSGPDRGWTSVSSAQPQTNQAPEQLPMGDQQAATAESPQAFGTQPSPVEGQSAMPDVPQQRQSFLVQESSEEPASRGFRGFLTRAGLKVGPNELERSERTDMMAVSQHWTGPRTIAVVNGKGGAGKTPTTILLSAVFALFGGAGVAAWDNNQTRGTLGWRTEQGGHQSTLLDLLPEVPRLLSTGAQAADLAHYVHHQTRDRFDVLRSQPMVLAHEQRIEPRDVDAIHAVLGKYYRLIFIDSGNDESDPMWLRMIDHADQLVVATTTRNDHAEAGALLLEALAARDERSAQLARNSVAVITQADSNSTGNDVHRVTGGYQSLTRSTVPIPFDPGMVDGQLLFAQLKPGTQRAWLAAAAAVATGL